jgi:thiol-disulfide isomerase/thioredoxin
MRRLLMAVLVAAVLVLTGCNADDVQPPGDAKVNVDTPALRELKQDAGVADCQPGSADAGGLPDLTLPCLGGGADVDLASLQGPVVLNLWASTCGPCRKEMPALQAFHEQYGDQVPVIGIDYQDVQPAEALKLARKSGVTYPLLADPGGDINGRDPVPVMRGIPMFLFVSADGDVQVVPGGIDSVDELVDLVDEHLGVSL